MYVVGFKIYETELRIVNLDGEESSHTPALRSIPKEAFVKFVAETIKSGNSNMNKSRDMLNPFDR